MTEFFARPVLEIIIIFIFATACVGGLSWLFIFLFKPKLIKIGRTEITNQEKEPQILLEKSKEEFVIRDIRLVVSQSVMVGFEICKMKLVDVIQTQDQYADERFEGWNLSVKDHFLKILGKNSKYQYDDNLSTTNEARLFFNVLRGFTDKCKSTLHMSFAANNFRFMTENEFLEMIKRKSTLLESIFDKYFVDNYFEEVCTLSIVAITKDLKDLIRDDFNRMISDIFVFAKTKKLETELAVDKKKSDLESYIREYVNKDFTMDC